MTEAANQAANLPALAVILAMIAVVFVAGMVKGPYDRG
jgi:hypothetical protein